MIPQAARIPGALAPAWGLLGVAFAAVSLWVLAGTHIASPYADAWEWVAELTRLSATGDLAGYLFRPHHGHLLVWTRGLLLVDQTLGGGRNWAFVGVSVAMLAAVSAALARTLAREAGASSPGSTVLALFLVWLAPNLLDAGVLINALYVHGATLSMLALMAWGRPGWGWALASIALAMLACLSVAAALAVWPALVLGALQARDWKRLGLALASGAPVAALLTMTQLAAVDAVTAGQAALPGLADIATYALGYLGLPLTRASALTGLIAGGGLAVAGIWMIAASLNTRSPLRRLAGGLAMFSLVTAALAAVGRAGLDGGDIPVRYAMLVTPLHLAVVLWAADLASKATGGRLRWIQGAMLGLGLALLGLQVLVGQALVEVSARNRALIAAFEAGRRDPAMVPTVHPDLDHAWRVREDAIRAGVLRP